MDIFRLSFFRLSLSLSLWVGGGCGSNGRTFELWRTVRRTTNTEQETVRYTGQLMAEACLVDERSRWEMWSGLLCVKLIYVKELVDTQMYRGEIVNIKYAFARFAKKSLHINLVLHMYKGYSKRRNTKAASPPFVTWRPWERNLSRKNHLCFQNVGMPGIQVKRLNELEDERHRTARFRSIQALIVQNDGCSDGERVR